MSPVCPDRRSMLLGLSTAFIPAIPHLASGEGPEGGLGAAVVDLGTLAGDPHTDSTDAVRLAFARLVAEGGGTLRVPADYTCTANVSVAAPGLSIGITGPGSLTMQNSMLTIQGTSTRIGSLAAPAARGSHTLRLDTARDLRIGDKIALVDLTDWSFGAKFAGRQYYCEGDQGLHIVGINGTTVTLDRPLAVSFDGRQTDLVYRVRPVQVQTDGGFSIRGGGDYAFHILHGDRCHLKSLNCEGGRHAALFVSRSTRCVIDGGRYSHRSEKLLGTNYGISIANCRDVTVRDANGFGSRHGIATGGGGKVRNRQLLDSWGPNENVVVSGGRWDNGVQDLQAVDFHGNCRSCGARGVTSDNAIMLGGYDPFSEGCTATTRGTLSPVTWQELQGGTVRVLGNVLSKRSTSTAPASCRHNSSAPQKQMETGFTYIFDGNTVDASAFDTALLVYNGVRNLPYSAQCTNLRLTGQPRAGFVAVVSAVANDGTGPEWLEIGIPEGTPPADGLLLRKSGNHTGTELDVASQTVTAAITIPAGAASSPSYAFKPNWALPIPFETQMACDGPETGVRLQRVQNYKSGREALQVAAVSPDGQAATCLARISFGYSRPL